MKKKTSINLQGNLFQRKLNNSFFSNFIEKLSYFYFLKKTKTYFKRKDIVCVDVGCGSGSFANQFLRLRNTQGSNIKTKYIGIDASEEVGKFFKTNVPQAKFMLDNAEELSKIKNKSIDILVSFHNIEHLYNPEKFFSAAQRILKKNSYLYLSCPNPSSISAFYDKDKWAGFHPSHVSLKAPFEYRFLLKMSGFEIIEDGTTFVSGLSLIRNNKFLNFISKIILLFFGGCINWPFGEAYICLAQKK